MTDQSISPIHLSRRQIIRLGTGSALLGMLGGCSSHTSAEIRPDSPQVRAFAEAEQRRFPHGASVGLDLTAAPTRVDIGGSPATAWLYNAQLPGPIIRANVGDRVTVRLDNRLPEPTTIHWHGLAIRNDMDGVPTVTQPPVASGDRFVYEFIPPNIGTYWYHTHADLQRGRGLYGALIIDDPAAPTNYDAEFIIVLSEWLGRRTPAQVFNRLRRSMSARPSLPATPTGPTTPSTGMSPTGTGSMNGPEMTSTVLGGDAGDVSYPTYLMNGRPPSDPPVFSARPGQRVRIRIINSGDDTTFRVALGGHRLTVDATDGFPVERVPTDSVLVSMGERYDAIVSLRDGVFPLVAAAEGKTGQALAIVRTASGPTPKPTARPTELAANPLTVAGLRAADIVRLPAKEPDVTIRALLEGDMGRYTWTINDRAYPTYAPLQVRPNQRVRLIYTNKTSMYHPMHLHGHTFAVVQPGCVGPRKDTVIVLPGQTVATDIDTVNPGQWIVHCHNDYHLAAGMATILSYRS